MSEAEGKVIHCDGDPGQRNQHAEHDRRNADHVNEYIERVLVRSRIAGEHIHEFSVRFHHFVLRFVAS